MNRKMRIWHTGHRAILDKKRNGTLGSTTVAIAIAPRDMGRTWRVCVKTRTDRMIAETNGKARRIVLSAANTVNRG